MNFPPKRVLSFLLAGSLAACGGDPEETAYAALQSGDFEQAAELLGRLAGEAEGKPRYLGLAVDHCRALAHVDPARAESAFLALVEAQGEQVGPRDYSIVVNELAGVRAFDQAITLLAKGAERFKDDPKMKALYEKVKARASEAGDPEIMDRIKSLPYAGG